MIGLVAGVHLRLDDRAGVQVHHRLGLVNHVRRAVFSPADFSVRIIRVHPFLVAAFARPVAIKFAHRHRVRRINPVLCRQAFDIIPVLLLRIAMHQSPQRRIGLDDRRINPQMFAAQQPVRAQGLQGQGEDPLINVQAQALADDRETGVIGGLLIQLVIEKRADRHRIGAARRNGAFARQIFEKPDHDHLKVNDRIYAGTAGARLLVGRDADRTHFRGKSEGLQGLVELGVEGGFRRCG